MERARPPNPLPMTTALFFSFIRVPPSLVFFVSRRLFFQDGFQPNPLLPLKGSILQNESHHGLIYGWRECVGVLRKVHGQCLKIGGHGVVTSQEEGQEQVACQPEVSNLQVVRILGYQAVKDSGASLQVFELVPWPTGVLRPHHLQGPPVSLIGDFFFRRRRDAGLDGRKRVFGLVRPLALVHAQEVHGPDPLQPFP